MNTTRSIVVLLATLSMGVACADAPTGTATRSSATVVLSLTTPNADDGAVRFTVHGPRIDSVTAATASLRVFTRRVDASTVMGVAVGAVTGGPVLTLRVSDTSAMYTAQVAEVADRQNTLRATLAGYTLTVAP